MAAAPVARRERNWRGLIIVVGKDGETWPTYSYKYHADLLRLIDRMATRAGFWVQVW